MVGSGLSRQAERGHPSECRPPTWGKLAALLQEELRSDEPGSDSSSPAERVTARDCSRLAQQYKATFGQTALDSFLRERVPDGEPGSIHERLLRLPWADVFSTNWDTLLEKAAGKVFDQTYDPVLQSADLATAVAPRIVKLHGSFPSSRPFVVTEEDYRTYPTRFAPLVNTVQQALMESIFLLVGFSGDDPNFLHWCGWVRDHLGTAAPRLYLAGLLGLDRPTRLMLEERGVIPIDLTSEVSGARNREEGHRRAIEWILGSLEAGETREELWPSPPPQSSDPGAIGITLPVPPSGQPREVSGAPDDGSGAEPLAEQVNKVVADWRHNRRVYPGWPILPFSKHFGLSADTERWVESMLQALPALDPPGRLRAVREVIERHELLMDPMTPKLATAATETLTAVEEYLTGSNGLTHERQHEVTEDRIALMLALLTYFRHDLNQTGFENWERRLGQVARPGTSAFHRLQHERCLWQLRVQDFAGLVARLNAWRTGAADPMWSLRKAALLVESGEVDDGRRVALEAIQRAEGAWSRDRRVRTAARLGWAIQWREAMRLMEWSKGPVQSDGVSQAHRDLRAELAAHDSDARSNLDAYVREMTKEQSEESPWTFDLRRVNRFTWSNAEARSFRAAMRVVRLLELAGLPSGLPRVRIASEYIGRAASLVGPYFPAYAARLLLVGGSGSEKTLDAAVSQTQLARMSDKEASALFEAAQRARDYFVGNWTAGGRPDDSELEAAHNAIEIMSRCIARHGVASAPDIFKWAVNYRRSQHWVDIRFWSSIAKLWERSWNAMDLGSRASAVPEILGAPIPENALFVDADPGDLLLRELPKIKRSDVDQSVWTSSVHRICAALRGSENARHLAFERLRPIARRHLLTETEEQEVARALWGTVHEQPAGLPKVPRVDDWEYLVLPEPEPGIAAQRFRGLWIGPNATQADAERREQTIRNVAVAWNPDHVGDRVIHLLEEEQEWFWGMVEEWLRHESTQRLKRGTTDDPAVRLLLDVLTHHRAPESMLHRLAENAQPVTRRRHPIAEQWTSPENEFLMVAASAALGGGERSEAEDRLRLGARSPDGRVSLAAWNALRWWIRKAGQTGEPLMRPPSVDSVGDIGVVVGTTQQSGLIGALTVARTVYEGGNPQFIAAIHSRVVEGLRRLRSELDYRTSSADRWVADELPLRRHWCVWLAWAITGAGRGDDEVIKSWIEAGDNDPLCLVRFAREWYAASQLADDEEEGS